ncbi:MAG: alpha-L-rhamnosidase N-terminal domain-containing protein [Planctomycetaceae bacterium]|nr:alpha-L-rhamnosidase N-terminal domain-containing protein [Planctomycetaceae bacterium]
MSHCRVFSTGFGILFLLGLGISFAATPATPIAEIDQKIVTGDIAAFEWRPVAVDLAPAQWIWMPSQRTLSNTFLLFRREITLDAPLKKATGWITADSRYLLSVNGKRVQWGPAPCDPRVLDVDPIDLTAFLKQGKNVIGSEVLFYGLGDGTSPAGKPGFLFYLTLEFQDGRKELIVSDPGWQVKIDRGHQPGMHKRWFLRSLQEEFDARLSPVGWNDPDANGFYFAFEFNPRVNPEFLWQTGQDGQNYGWVNAMPLSCSPAKPPSCSGYEGNDLIDRTNSEDCSLRIREIPLIKEIEIPVAKLTEMGVVDWKRDPRDWFDMRVPDSFTIKTETVAKEMQNGVWEVNAPTKRNQGQFLTFELEEQVVGFPYFTIEAPEGTVVDLMVQEAHTPGGNLWLDSQFYSWSRFVCRGGVNHFQTYDFESLRWMQLHVSTDAPVKISNVGVRRRMYDWPNPPKVACSEPELQRLFNATINTVYNSCLDTCVDGMARERQQYSGDGGHQLRAVRSVFGETRLPKRFLRTFSEGQSPDAYFMDSWPAFDRLARVMQKQIGGAYWGPLLDHGVGFNFDCWLHYLETGDLASLEEPYPRLVKFADYLDSLREADGLLPVENLGIPTVWMDHIAFQKQKHKQCAFNLYAAAMLEHALAPMAEAKGDVKRARIFAERGRELREKTIAKYWDPVRKTFVNNRPWLEEEKSPRMDDRSLATAILFNQCPGNDIAESLRLLVEQPPEMGYSYPCNACWRYWVLCRCGRSDLVLKEFRERWGKMDSVLLNNTLAEDWNARSDSGSQWSHCAVAPLFVLYSDIAGIRPTAPGFASCEIRPQLGDLADLQLTYYTPQGPIEFSARRQSLEQGNEQGHGHHVTVKVPESCDAKLILPDGSSGELIRVKTEK